MADALRYLSWLCGLFAGWALTSPATAQVSGAPASQVVRFTVFAAQPIAEIAFVPRAKAAPQKLTFYPTARSPRYEYRGPMPLRFVDATNGATIAEATIPPGLREAMLLFTPIEPPAGGAGKPALRYRIAVLDDSAARHGPGGLAIINLSGLALSGTVNQEAVTLRSGLNPTIAVGRSAKIVLRTTVKQRTHQSFAATVPLTTRQRALLLLFPPFYKGSVEAQSRLLVDEPLRPASSR